MTNIRAFFILKDEEILISERYPTIERKIQLISGKSYYNLPIDSKILPLFKKVH